MLKSLFRNVVTNVVLPALGRTGTAVATVLVGYGVQAEPAHQIGVGVAAAVAVGLDLVSDWWGRRTVADKTFREAVGTIWNGEAR